MSAAAAVPAREPATARAPHRAAASPRSRAPVDPLAARAADPLARPGFVLQRCACGGGCPACRAKAAGVPALPIHPADDACEREADHVADAVLRGDSASASTTPALPARSRLQRCSCGGGGTCPECAAKEEMQRSAPGEGGAGGAPPIVHEVLRSPGEPLDAAAREFLEPRFGRSFGDVRVHADGRAAESARAVRAAAYTVGADVVFGAGRYRPGSAEGRRLIAHELTHVVQQADGAPRALRRQGPEPGSKSGTEPAPCETMDNLFIVPAMASAHRWLRAADERLTAYAPGTTETQVTAEALRRHFSTDDADTALYVRNRIRDIAQMMGPDPAAPASLVNWCAAPDDPECAVAAAYVPGRRNVVFCPSFFPVPGDVKPALVVHELAHALFPSGRPMFITDRAYRFDRRYGTLSQGEALTNAESYALLVWELATGPVAGTAPQDTFTDCAEWQGAIQAAVGRAQRWNRDAQVVFTGPAGENPWWGDLADTHLGGRDADRIAVARNAYDRTADRLDFPVGFQCEVQGGGRCDTSQSYWYMLGDYHLCPSWFALATDDDRAESLLSGLYGYWGIVDDGAVRRGIARLARALHETHWAAPHQAVVDTALAAEHRRSEPPPVPAPAPAPVPAPP